MIKKHNFSGRNALRVLMLLAFFTLHSSLFTLNAQTIGDAFYVYRNDGQFNAFFRDEVQRIDYSYEDADGNRYDEIVTQLVYTADSVYKIPLAAIDSVSFVQPETIYKQDAIPLAGSLLDYLISADGMTLTFDRNLPAGLIPKIDDKIVTMELTEKLPYGFAGIVTNVATLSSGIEVVCDSIDLDEVVERFYGVVAYGGDESYYSSSSKDASAGKARYFAPKRAFSVVRFYELPNTPINIPIDISAYITKKSIYDINGKAEINVNIRPQTKAKITLVVDGLRSRTDVLLTCKLVTSTRFDICGEANKDMKLNLLPNNGNYKGPWGIPLYFAIGPKLEFGGEMVAGFTADATIDVVSDITYYPVSAVVSALSPLINTVTGRVNISGFNLSFDQVGARGNLKLGPYFRAGVSLGTHERGWIGLEADGGAKCDVNFIFDIARLREADRSTALYDELKSICNFEAKPYWGIHFMASAKDDRYTFKVGPEFDKFGSWFKGGLLPSFEDTRLSHSSRGKTSADASTKISGACPIPYSVGFSLFDADGNKVQQPVYHGEKYSVFNSFHSYKGNFDNLSTGGFYTVYPTVRLFGYNMLASPSANLRMDCPVSLSDFKVTDKKHQQSGFTHNGRQYDYRFDVSVTATLDEDATDIADWGYAYLDPNGQEALISLKQFGRSYTDTRYAYFRNEPKSTCTLYGYVIYSGSTELVYGEPVDYPLEFTEFSCPDDHHPHMIDLGLPSGTKWACCNVGASAPEQYGSYFAWGETSPKSVYNEVSYSYCTGQDTDGDGWIDENYSVVNIGSDIAGTSYDAATVNWGSPWVMPSKEQMDELKNNCTSEWTTENGVNGRRFTGANGASIFLPAAGCRWKDDLYHAGSYGVYWSSLRGSGTRSAWSLDFGSGYVRTCYGSPDHGQSVRPVRKN